MKLRFDVGIERYTTLHREHSSHPELRFDVGIERYTTHGNFFEHYASCGLM